MKTQIGQAELTTEHAASSYGMPVLVLDGVAYGPEDNLNGFAAGTIMVTSDAVTMQRLDAETVEALCKWLRQSAANGERWIKAVRSSAQKAPDAEFPDEGVGAK